ncbi:hypothetical protein MBLNU457_4950t1 [Dothideomycetes sp. NU457]
MKSYAIWSMAGMAATVSAHGFITSPSARMPGSAMAVACGQQVYYNQKGDNYGNVQGMLQVAKSQSDYDAAACNIWMCKGYKYADNTANVQTYTVGQVVPITFDIRAPHTGVANVSVVRTSDNTVIGSPLISWDVFASNSASIPADETSFSVTIPDVSEDCAAPGACVLQHFWNAADIDQTYESCVDFVVSGSGSGSGSGSASSVKASSAIVSKTSSVASVTTKAALVASTCACSPIKRDVCEATTVTVTSTAPAISAPGALNTAVGVGAIPASMVTVTVTQSQADNALSASMRTITITQTESRAVTVTQTKTIASPGASNTAVDDVSGSMITVTLTQTQTETQTQTQTQTATIRQTVVIASGTTSAVGPIITEGAAVSSSGGPSVSIVTITRPSAFAGFNGTHRFGNTTRTVSSLAGAITPANLTAPSNTTRSGPLTTLVAVAPANASAPLNMTLAATSSAGYNTSDRSSNTTRTLSSLAAAITPANLTASSNATRSGPLTTLVAVAPSNATAPSNMTLTTTLSSGYNTSDRSSNATRSLSSLAAAITPASNDSSSEASPITTSARSGPITETLYSTQRVTVTSCGPEVTNCPARSTVISSSLIPTGMTTYSASLSSSSPVSPVSLFAPGLSANLTSNTTRTLSSLAAAITPANLTAPSNTTLPAPLTTLVAVGPNATFSSPISPVSTSAVSYTTVPDVYITEIVRETITTCPVGYTLTTSGSSTVLSTPSVITTSYTATSTVSTSTVVPVASAALLANATATSLNKTLSAPSTTLAAAISPNATESLNKTFPALQTTYVTVGPANATTTSLNTTLASSTSSSLAGAITPISNSTNELSPLANLTSALPASLLTSTIATTLPTAVPSAYPSLSTPSKPLPSDMSLQDLLDWCSYLIGKYEGEKEGSARIAVPATTNPLSPPFANLTTALPASLLTSTISTALPTAAPSAYPSLSTPSKPLPSDMSLQDLLEWVSYLIGEYEGEKEGEAHAAAKAMDVHERVKRALREKRAGRRFL